MINKGFVPDSDTDKELALWQQNRGKSTESTQAEIKQQYQNKMNNAQGQHFEREILAGCRYYRDKGIATIDKTPEPFRVIKKTYGGRFQGQFIAHAQPDFQGTIRGGKSIIFEAKRTSKDRILRNILTDEQMQVLEEHLKLGAMCYVCACIQDKFFFIPWRIWREMKEIYGRQYITAVDAEQYQVKFDGSVYFLGKLLENDLI